MRTFILLLFAVVTLSCSTLDGRKTLDLVTPDNFGISQGDGDITMKGIGKRLGNFGQEGSEVMKTESTGETTSTAVWLEWSLPNWEQEKPAFNQKKHFLEVERLQEEQSSHTQEIQVLLEQLIKQNEDLVAQTQKLLAENQKLIKKQAKQEVIPQAPIHIHLEVTAPELEVRKAVVKPAPPKEDDIALLAGATVYSLFTSIAGVAGIAKKK